MKDPSDQDPMICDFGVHCVLSNRSVQEVREQAATRDISGARSVAQRTMKTCDKEKRLRMTKGKTTVMLRNLPN